MTRNYPTVPVPIWISLHPQPDHKNAPASPIILLPPWRRMPAPAGQNTNSVKMLTFDGGYPYFISSPTRSFFLPLTPWSWMDESLPDFQFQADVYNSLMTVSFTPIHPSPWDCAFGRGKHRIWVIAMPVLIVSGHLPVSHLFDISRKQSPPNTNINMPAE